MDGKPLKTISADSPDGATASFIIPASLLAGGEAARDATALSELVGVKEYAERRAHLMEQLPWAGTKLPGKIGIVTDLGGYGTAYRNGTRHSDPAIVEAELRTLRQLGVNGLRAMPSYLLEKIKAGR